MTWVTWRQHRALFVGVGIALLAVTLVIVVTGVEAHVYTGAHVCNDLTGNFRICGQADFVSSFGFIPSEASLSILLPGLVAVFVGPTLVAREVETGTHRLSWTQSVTRLRWLSSKLVAAAVIVLAWGTVLGVLVPWWIQAYDSSPDLGPFTSSRSALEVGRFDVLALMPAAYLLFGLALGIAAAAVLRQALPAMIVTLGGFIGVRVAVAGLRSHFMTPLFKPFGAIQPFTSQATADLPWDLVNGWKDAAGNLVEPAQVERLCTPGATSSCLQAHGLVAGEIYQPADRFWPFQLIEAGIFLALTAALVVLTVYWVRRRIH